jgi:hypothetical protein
VLYGSDGPPVGILILMGLAVAHKLLAGSWMLAFGKARKFLRADSTGEAEPLCKPPLPFALSRSVLGSNNSDPAK